MRRNIELTPRDLSEKAFFVYSLSSFYLTEEDGSYYIDQVYIGDSLEDVNAYLEEIADMDEEE